MNLFTLLPEIDKFLEYAIIQQKPVPVSTLREETRYNFPKWAIKELLMNAIMHRDYESNAPVKFYQFADRIEIVNPGGLYGNAHPEIFPNVNDYRNPSIAEVIKVLGYVNRFNRGIARVKVELEENGNQPTTFDYDKIGVFGVTVFGTFYEEKAVDITLKKTSEKILGLIINDPNITIKELSEFLGVTSRSIERNMDKLKKQGKIKRIGSNKVGYWKIIGKDKQEDR